MQYWGRMQAAGRKKLTVSRCYVRMVSMDGVGTSLSLDNESDGGEDGVWRASTTWDPESSNLPELETDATGRITPAAIDVQFEIDGTTQSGAAARFCASTFVHVKQVRRCECITGSQHQSNGPSSMVLRCPASPSIFYLFTSWQQGK